MVAGRDSCDLDDDASFLIARASLSRRPTTMRTRPLRQDGQSTRSVFEKRSTLPFCPPEPQQRTLLTFSLSLFTFSFSFHLRSSPSLSSSLLLPLPLLLESFHIHSHSQLCVIQLRFCTLVTEGPTTSPIATPVRVSTSYGFHGYRQQPPWRSEPLGAWCYSTALVRRLVPL